MNKSIFKGYASQIESIENKTTEISENSTDTQYPSAAAVYKGFVAKEDGKGLSQNDYTDDDKKQVDNSIKIAGISNGELSFKMNAGVYNIKAFTNITFRTYTSSSDGMMTMGSTKLGSTSTDTFLFVSFINTTPSYQIKEFRLSGGNRETVYRITRATNATTGEYTDTLTDETPKVDQTYTPTSPNAQSGLATAEAVGVANDYTDKAIKSSKTYANNTFAPAIKNTVSGGVLAVHDVSPVEHALGVSVRSKNLWTNSKRNWGNSFTVTFEDSNNITATVNGNSIIPIFEWTFYDYRSWGNSITVSFDYEFVNSADDVVRPNEFMCIGRKDGTNTFLGISKLGNDTAKKQTFSRSYTIDTDADYDYIRFGFYGSVLLGDFENYQVTLTNMQLELGSTATPYTPYVADLSAVGVSRLGKNITPYEHYVNKNSVYTTDGVTFTDNGDGSITANGTATKNIFYWFIPSGTFLLHSGTLTFSGCPSECLDMMKDIYLAVGQHPIYTKTENGAGITFKMESAIYAGMSINIASGVTCNNITFKPQLEYSSIATDYEPYIEPQTVTANADGTVEGLTSLSPNITVTTDTEGVVIDMTYNADTKMYIDNKLAEISTAIVNNV